MIPSLQSYESFFFSKLNAPSFEFNLIEKLFFLFTVEKTIFHQCHQSLVSKGFSTNSTSKVFTYPSHQGEHFVFTGVSTYIETSYNLNCQFFLCKIMWLLVTRFILKQSIKVLFNKKLN